MICSLLWYVDPYLVQGPGVLPFWNTEQRLGEVFWLSCFWKCYKANTWALTTFISTSQWCNIYESAITTTLWVKCRTFIMVSTFWVVQISLGQKISWCFFIANEIEGENVQRKNLQHQVLWIAADQRKVSSRKLCVKNEILMFGWMRNNRNR